MHIFCDKKANQRTIRRIAYNTEGRIWAKISKNKVGDSPLMAKVLDIEEALHLALLS